MNSNSLKTVSTYAKPSLSKCSQDDKFQFDRLSHFVADRLDHAAGKLVFNLAVGLTDTWNK